MPQKPILVTLFLLILKAGIGQPPPADKWIKLLQDKSSKQCLSLARACANAQEADSLLRESYFTTVSAATQSNNEHLAAHALLVKPFLSALLKMQISCDEKSTDRQNALRIALQTDDKYLLAECLQRLGDGYNDCRYFDKALLYMLKSYELKQQLNFINFPDGKESVLNLGGVFFQAQEYDSCIAFTQRSLDMPGKFHEPGKQISACNIIAISYQRKKQFDTAAAWFDKAYTAAVLQQDKSWPGIIKGNMGYLKMLQGKYNAAVPLMWEDYYSALRQKDTSSAGNTLQRIARIYSETGKKDSALILAFKAYNHTLNIRRYNNPNHRMYASETLADVLQVNGNPTDALKYLRVFHRLQDSMDATIAASKLDRVRLTIDYEKSTGQVEQLKKQNRTEKQRRQLLIVALVLLLVSGLLFISWTKQKNKLKEQRLLQEKEKAENEKNAAQERLSLFTQNIIEKNELIEQLQQQLQNQSQQVNEELLKQTILTDEDWRRFKEMFEKVNPGFFKSIQSIAPDITAAEMRMAAVIKLGLGNKYIASMLGVSGDTVRKAKFRLRQRLQLTEEIVLEDYIAGIS